MRWRRFRDEELLDQERDDRLVRPFYRQMMGASAIAHGRDLLPAIAAAGANAAAPDVIALLRSGGWREEVIGAWLALQYNDESVTGQVLQTLARSRGVLTAPPLATSAVVLAGTNAVTVLGEYHRRDTTETLGAGGSWRTRWRTSEPSSRAHQVTTIATPSASCSP